MEQGKNLYRFLSHTVGHNVRRALDDELTRALDATGTT